MTDYLLSTQSLLDRLSAKNSYPVYDWLNTQRTEDTSVSISVVSIGYARARIEMLTDTADRKKYEFILNTIVNGFKKSGILHVDESIATSWATLLGVDDRPERYQSGRGGSRRVKLSDADLLVVATALKRNLTLVEPAQPYHADFSSYGLTVETLGE